MSAQTLEVSLTRSRNGVSSRKGCGQWSNGEGKQQIEYPPPPPSHPSGFCLVSGHATPPSPCPSGFILASDLTFIRAAQNAFTTPVLPERAALCSGVSRQRSLWSSCAKSSARMLQSRRSGVGVTRSRESQKSEKAAARERQGGRVSYEHKRRPCRTR